MKTVLLLNFWLFLSCDCHVRARASLSNEKALKCQFVPSFNYEVCKTHVDDTSTKM